MKAPDATTVPLCFHCHNAWHSIGALPALSASENEWYLTRDQSIAVMQEARIRLREEWVAVKARMANK